MNLCSRSSGIERTERFRVEERSVEKRSVEERSVEERSAEERSAEERSRASRTSRASRKIGARGLQAHRRQRYSRWRRQRWRQRDRASSGVPQNAQSASRGIRALCCGMFSCKKFFYRGGFILNSLKEIGPRGGTPRSAGHPHHLTITMEAGARVP